MAVSQAPEFWLNLITPQVPGGQLVGSLSISLDWAELFNPRSWVCMLTPKANCGAGLVDGLNGSERWIMCLLESPRSKIEWSTVNTQEDISSPKAGG
jgi:hypothetical protein